MFVAIQSRRSCPTFTCQTRSSLISLRLFIEERGRDVVLWFPQKAILRSARCFMLLLDQSSWSNDLVMTHDSRSLYAQTTQRSRGTKMLWMEIDHIAGCSRRMRWRYRLAMRARIVIISTWQHERITEHRCAWLSRSQSRFEITYYKIERMTT